MMEIRGFRFYPMPINLAIIMAMFYSFTTANPFLSVFALLVIIILPRLVWLRGHPPLLVVCMTFQWMQASTKILQANFANEDVAFYTDSMQAENAIMSSLGGILVIALGIHLMIGKSKYPVFNPATSVTDFDLDRSFRLFFIFLGISIIISGIIFVIPGLAQVLLSAVYLKWIFYCLLFFLVFSYKKKYHYLVVIFLIEFGYNSFGYYSSFKEVIFVTAILLGAVIKKLNVTITLITVPVVILLFNLFTVWTGIKGEYRSFLTSNASATFGEKVNYISDLYSNFIDFDIAREHSLQRLAYTDMLMYSMETIPMKRPHENGKVWLAAVEHILMPRILFPNKRVLHDSEKANEYTGRVWSGIERGTSISIGYITESYVDFGKVGMFVPLLLLGLLVGAIYNSILSYNYPPALLFSILIPAIYFTKFSLIENSNDKLLGALIMNFLVFTLFVRYGLSYALRYIKK